MKKTKRTLTVVDEVTVVRAELFIENCRSLEYINEQCREVRVLSPLPKKDVLIDNFKDFAKSDPQKPTVKDQVNFYIRCREQTIFEQIQEIRKSIKRIGRQLECIKDGRRNSE